ncbi:MULTISPECIES: hypothetical protein [Pseudomonas syringae group]|uniref:Uncharacterized protein n=8 Tax=Pseudomonas syringae group TaxID=136849 RepID=A0A2K4WWZ8_PSESX|nr:MULTISPECIES: hypothetical protein [Pseudomonas syringae group]KPX03466.1 Uncharacterized protein ALO74_03854 [Pseudomonas syringae pv. cunninghamiae]KPX27512.1 Uncharacterized protein ALO70_02396 [Pseudomonas amygdali pv. eriobotryae]KPX77873.1 Uncharacterized protein ALO53_03086 [Pseudomonas amygdali pv. photiniae]KPX99616.1 Uncharacterized protein ALO62_01173 [Pseudomonas amygdali pv. myricae]KPY08897.1 Uncharacterized protein ALO61_04070 [Pseudomonas savastanoi pv. nerii]KUG43910.1 Unc
MTEEKAVPPGETPPAESSLAPELPPLPDKPSVSANQTPTGTSLPAAASPSPEKLPLPLPELNLEKRLKQVYADQIMTSAEFMALRDDADVLFDKLKVQFPDNGALALFQPLSDVAVQAMQLGILEFKKGKPSAEAKALAKQSFGFQVAYIKACLDRFTQAL